MNSPEETHTLESFIQSNPGTESPSYYNYSIIEKVKLDWYTIHFTVSNLINDYLYELKDACYTIKLTDIELAKYRYNPDLLSYDVYGSINLNFMILKINNMINPKDFDMSIIKLIRPQELMSLLSRIYNAEHDYLESNRVKEFRKK